MTAEIVIMNKDAVALAADSAVTVGKKIYDTANKVFALSEYHPIGIMFYQLGSVNDVPWETVIKIYRRNLGEKEKSTVKEYAEDFRNFLATNRGLFPTKVQEEFFKNLVLQHFFEIKSDIEGKIAAPDGAVPIDAEEIKRRIHDIFLQELRAKLQQYQALGDFPGVTPSAIAGIKRAYDKRIHSLITEVFKGLPTSDEAVNCLKDIALLAIQKDIGIVWSGIVISGFGENEIFPACCSFVVKGIFNDTLICGDILEKTISIDQGSWILPFAQSEVALAFIRGMAPEYKGAMKAYIDGIMTKAADLVVDNAKSRFKLDEGVSAEFAKILKPAFQDMSNDVHEKMERIEFDTYIAPIVNSVAVLPKDELAALAETLVNLTSLRRRFTSDAETVGGPIDVAVISKGDGLIWVKRKHYFKPELNPHFFQNYFRQTGARK